MYHLDTEKDVEPLIVCTSLLRLAHNHGRAVNVLHHQGLSESVVSWKERNTRDLDGLQASR